MSLSGAARLCILERKSIDMGNAIVPRATVANSQPRHSDGRFAPMAVTITRRQGQNRLAGVVQRANEERPTGQGIVKVGQEEEERRSRLTILK